MINVYETSDIRSYRFAWYLIGSISSTLLNNQEKTNYFEFNLSAICFFEKQYGKKLIVDLKTVAEFFEKKGYDVTVLPFGDMEFSHIDCPELKMVFPILEMPQLCMYIVKKNK